MGKMKIKSIKKIGHSEVYDITVKEHSNYILENGVVTHNSGLKYAASTIAMLGKSKDRDGKEVIGNIIKIKMYKSRMSKENSETSVKLSYSYGLDRYYGLLELAEKYGIITKSGTKYELPDGRKVFGKYINENPEEVYTKELLDQIDKAAAKEFKYGVHDEDLVAVEESDE